MSASSTNKQQNLRTIQEIEPYSSDQKSSNSGGQKVTLEMESDPILQAGNGSSESSTSSNSQNNNNYNGDRSRGSKMDVVREGGSQSQGSEEDDMEEIVMHPDLESQDLLDFRYRKRHLEPLHIEKWTVETEKKTQWEWRKSLYRMICGSVCVVFLLVAVGVVWDLAARGINHGSSNDEEEGVYVPSCTYPVPGELPLWIQPQSYDITLYLNSQHFQPPPFTTDVFVAQTSITFQVEQNTRCVALRSSNLTYDQVSIYTPQQGTVCLCGQSAECQYSSCSTPSSVVYYRKKESIVVFDLGEDNQLFRNSGQQLILKYRGIFHDEQQLGLFRSQSFSNGDGNQEVLVSTQLVSPNMEWPNVLPAKLLPCFTDMTYKAEFSVQVVVEDGQNLVALSNMQLQDQVDYGSSGYKYQFQTTPLMSPYLLAITVGQFDLQTATTASGVNITVGSAKNRSKSPFGVGSLLDYPIQVATKAYEFFEQWTNFPLPFTKMHLVAIPGKQFSQENWGLLMFDENRFLVDPTSSDAYQQFRAADIICHEMAHQWFGNLVTAATIMDFLVNEGIASFLENKCVANVLQQLPESTEQILSMYVANPAWEMPGAHEGPLRNALVTGGDPFLKPLWPLSVAAPSIQLYSQAASILNMFDMFMQANEEDSMQSVLRDLLNTYQYDTYSVIDFVNTISVHLPSTFNLTDILTQQTQESSNQSSILDDQEQLIMTWFHNYGIPEIKFQYSSNSNTTDSNSLENIQLTGMQQQRKCNFGVVLNDNSISCGQIQNEKVGVNRPGFEQYDQVPQTSRWWIPLRFSDFSNQTENDAYDLNFVAKQLDFFGGNLQFEQFPRAIPSAGLFYGNYDQAFVQQLLFQLQNIDIFEGECPPTEYSKNQIDQYLQIGQFLLDLHFAAFSPFPIYKNQWQNVLDGMESVGKSVELISTETGRYITMVPLIDTILNFESYLSGDQQCMTNFRKWANEKLINPVVSKFQKLIQLDEQQGQGQGQNSSSCTPTPLDAFLGNLIQPYLSYTAVRFNNTVLGTKFTDAYFNCERNSNCVILNPQYLQTIYMTEMLQNSQQSWDQFRVRWRRSQQGSGGSVWNSQGQGHRYLMALTQTKGLELSDLLKEVTNGQSSTSSGHLQQSDSDSVWILAARNQPQTVLEVLGQISGQQAQNLPLQEIVQIAISSPAQQQAVIKAMQKWRWNEDQTLKIKSIIASKLKWIDENQQNVCNYISQ